MRGNARSELPANRLLTLPVGRVGAENAEIRVWGPMPTFAASAIGKLSKASDGTPSLVWKWRARRDSNPKPSDP